MGIMKLAFTMLMATALLVNVYSQNFGKNPLTWISVSPVTFQGCNVLNAPYVNFTAQGQYQQDVNGSVTTGSLYYTWDPDSRGTRPVQEIYILNTSTTQNVTFLLTSQDCWESTYQYVDNRLWCWNGPSNPPANVDDDHGQGYSFGAKVTLGPSTGLSFYISMYSSGSSTPWFGVKLTSADCGIPFDQGYAEVSKFDNNLPTIINGN